MYAVPKAEYQIVEEKPAVAKKAKKAEKVTVENLELYDDLI